MDQQRELTFDPCIRIPSDLFGENHHRHASIVLLPMAHSGRTAGVYPRPRPLLHHQPWTLQTVESKKRQAGWYTSRSYSHKLQGSDPGHVFKSWDEWQRQSWNHEFEVDVWNQQLSLPRSVPLNSPLSWQQLSLPRSVPLNSPLSWQKVNKKRMQADEVLVDEKSTGGGGGRGGQDDDELDDFIELVARANNVPDDTTSILPVVRASPCAMHNRHLHANRRDHDLLYATNCHGGKVTQLQVNLTGEVYNSDFGSLRHYRCSRSDYMSKGVRGIGVGGSGGEGKEGRRRKGKVASDRLASPPRGRPQQYAIQPRVMAAKLPSEMPPKDLVTTWLKHGSVPAGESHFPDIMQPTKRMGSRRHPSAPSE